MSSYLHELLILLFRNRSNSAADLLRAIDVNVPEYDEVRVESSDLGNVQPAEYRADLVLFLRRAACKVLGIIVEVQLGCDKDKPYVWPAYLANLRARHRCPACLLVITIDEKVTRWAQRPIELGPGTRCHPLVVGPSNTPTVTEPHEALENIELAVLSTIAHAQSTDIALATCSALAALVANAGIDDERFRLYFDFVIYFLSKSNPDLAETIMNSLGFEYKSDFARRYVAQGRTEGKTEGKAEGKAEGRMEGRIEMLLKQLAVRFGPVPEPIQTLIRSLQDAQLDTVAERVLTAPTLEEALAPQD
jgi:Domain of unknown function (DUF4351)